MVEEEKKEEAKEFVSEIEKIMPAKELIFPSTPGFGKYKALFPPSSVSHPAKMNTNLLEYLILNYTKEGENILDPMAGCYDEETEVLTRKGWKFFRDVTFDDEIATLNTSTDGLEYQHPIRIVKQPYKGKMYYVRTKEVELKVTPDHSMFVALRNSQLPKNKWEFGLHQAKEIFGKHVVYSREFIWKGKDIENVTLEEAPSHNQWKYSAIEIPLGLFLQFLGYYLAEGSAYISNSRHYVQIATDTKDRFQYKMVEVSKKLASILGRRVHIDKRGRIWLNDKRLCSFLHRLGKSTTKFIPREFLELPSDKLHLLLSALVEGDGARRGSRLAYYTSSKQLANDVQELALKCGYDSKVSLYKIKTSKIGSRIIKPTIQSYVVYMSKRTLKPRVYIRRNLWDSKRGNVDSSCIEEWVDYDGMIYCVEVPNHVILIRKNGKVVWCGNSGSTGVLSALHGRNAVLVELEKKFVETITGVDCDGYTCHVLNCYRRKDIEKEIAELEDKLKDVNEKEIEAKVVRKILPLGDFAESEEVDEEKTPPEIVKIWNDMERLKKLKEELEALPRKPHHYTGALENLKKGQFLTPIGSVKAIQGDARRLSELLSKEQADNVITSPPYAQMITQGGTTKVYEKKYGYQQEKNKGYSENPGNIGNLPVGDIDAVITSPPYSEGIGHKAGDKADSTSHPERLEMQKKYTESMVGEGNIAKLKHGDIDTIITSPPYSEGEHNYRHGLKELGDNFKGRKAWEEKRDTSLQENNIANLKHGNIDAVITSPPYGERRNYQDIERSRANIDKYFKEKNINPDLYAEDPANINRLEHKEDIDTIITSPPYANQEVGKGIRPNRWEKIKDREGFRGRKEWASGTPSHYSENPENIGNLPIGDVDTIITSPPYAESMQERGGTQHKFEKEKKIGVHYSHDKTNIGNLPVGNIDTVITSPPYEGSMEGGSRHTGGICDREKDSKSDTRLKIGLGIKYSEDKNNIGNLKRETYLEAMFKVYSEMYAVLKEGGRAIIVVKPFQRQGRVIDLPYQTWLLLEKIGFQLEDVLKLRLDKLSFWRILQYKKRPEVPRIMHEYILVCKKP